MRGYLMPLILCFLSFCSDAQNITGKFTQLAGETIRLEAFNGLKTYPVSSSVMDADGNFKLHYSKSDCGIGYLISTDQKPFFVILSGEDIHIQGESLRNTETVQVLLGQENQWFARYANEHPRREQALSAWNYLEKIYQNDSIFHSQDKIRQCIQSEQQRIKKSDTDLLSSLPPDSYVRWYLPTRKLVSSVSVIAQYRPEEIMSAIESFRKMDYTDSRLYRSGLFRDAIDSHFWLLENSGWSLDSVFHEMKISIDAMMSYLVKDEKKLNEVTDYLFDLLERHSLFQASEYLALKVLNEVSCTIDSNLAKQLETYRAMKKGNIAPDISFEAGHLWMPSSGQIQRLSDIKSKYVLVVFGAGWCPKCKEDIPELARLYSKWKAQGVEIVYISLDDDKMVFNQSVASLPFMSYCDFKKWKSPVVESYYVFATPTMFLLNDRREILLRPNSVKQADAWVDWFLVQGNR
ncbi:MAG: redoxin domain-containing protein [Saprospiraceae bacterium]|nr:redoxin domain-containing protein [Saprospiraceae bacterium]